MKRISAGFVCGVIFAIWFISTWIGCATREPRNPMRADSAAISTITSSTVYLDKDVTPRSNAVWPNDEEMLDISESLADYLLGRSEREAIQCIEIINNGWFFDNQERCITYRIASRNGETFALTCDYIVNRINLYIVDGIIVKATVG